LFILVNQKTQRQIFATLIYQVANAKAISSIRLIYLAVARSERHGAMKRENLATRALPNIQVEKQT
jgi:hypothetical protein